MYRLLVNLAAQLIATYSGQILAGGCSVFMFAFLIIVVYLLLF